jgi:hypothetical protein
VDRRALDHSLDWRPSYFFGAARKGADGATLFPSALRNRAAPLIFLQVLRSESLNKMRRASQLHAALFYISSARDPMTSDPVEWPHFLTLSGDPA